MGKHRLRRWALCLLALLFLAEAWPQGGVQMVRGGCAETPLTQALMAAWTAGESRVELEPPMPLAEVEAAYFALLDARPELFWVAHRFGYTADASGVIEVAPVYLCGGGAIPVLREAVETQVETLLGAVPVGASDYAAAYALHDALAAVATYGASDTSPLGGDGAYTAYGALVDGAAVCRGYAMAYLLLLARAGIAAEYVQSEDMAHGWVRACLDGVWLHIDVTWDDTGDGPVHSSFARTDAAMAQLGYTGWQTKRACAGPDV